MEEETEDGRTGGTLCVLVITLLYVGVSVCLFISTRSMSLKKALTEY